MISVDGAAGLKQQATIMAMMGQKQTLERRSSTGATIKWLTFRRGAALFNCSLIVMTPAAESQPLPRCACNDAFFHRDIPKLSRVSRWAWQERGDGNPPGP